MGGGGIYSTAGDYLRFVRMILNRGSGNGTRAEIGNGRPDVAQCNGRYESHPAQDRDAGSTNDAEFFPGMPKGWGLSFMINDEPAPTGRSVGSLAWAGLANTYFWIDPVKGVGGVFLTQVLPFADVKAVPLFYDFESTVYQSV